MADPIGVGDPAPDFTLPDQQGKSISLQDFRGQNVVLYFYPKDNTSVCTAQACAFRDSYQDFQDAGAQVIGVSSDSSKSHDGFASRHRLPFILLSDKGGALRKLFGVPRSLMGLLPGRVTYVIDRQGVVRGVYNAATKGAEHVDEALKVLKSL